MERVQVETLTGEGHELVGADLQGLRNRFEGRLILPFDGEYEQARQVWNGMIDQHPAMILQAESVEDVAAAVRYASRYQLLLSVRGGGHNVAGRAMLEGALVIDLSGMRGVSVDPGARQVRAEGGALLEDLNVAAGEYGLALSVGVVSETGIAGLTLHGGYGWLSRKFGLSLDNLVAMEVVCADGVVREASAERNGDLFWALRGGGGNFGVVTAFEFQAHRIPSEIWFAAPTYPAGVSREVLADFAAFMEEAPDEVSALASLWTAPDIPEVPEEMRGEPVVTLVGCYYGSVEAGQEALGPLYDFDSPGVDLGGAMSFVEANRFFDEDYPDGNFYYWKAAYIDRLDEEILEILEAGHRERPSLLSNIDVWALGGAAARVAPGETAYLQRYSPLMVTIEAQWEEASQATPNIIWAREIFRKLQHHSPGGLYLNFPGFAEEEDQVEEVYEQNFGRLQAVKEKYDPENLFRGTFNISPLSESARQE